MTAEAIPEPSSNPVEVALRYAQNTLRNGYVVEAYLKDFAADQMGQVANNGLVEPTYGNMPKPQPLTNETFDHLYDGSQPTLGLRTRDALFFGSVLSMAASNLRNRGEPVCNVVLLPEQGIGRETVSTQGLFASQGVLVNETGVAHYGKFPRPIRIDALQRTDHDTDRLPATMRYVNDPAETAALNDKSQAHEAFGVHGLPQSKLLLSEISSDDPQLSHYLGTEFLKRRAVVIKPVRAERGQRVLLLDPASVNLDAALYQISQVYEKPESVIVERWVRSLALRHPDTKVLLDWNIRTILVGGQSLGGYARVGKHGSPINLATGADVESLADTLSQCQLSDDDKRVVYKRLDALHHAIAQAFPKSQLIGTDIIITDKLEPVIIELNDERSGGFNHILKTSFKNPAERLAQTEKMLLALNGRLFDTSVVATNTSEARAALSIEPEQLISSIRSVAASVKTKRTYRARQLFKPRSTGMVIEMVSITRIDDDGSEHEMEFDFEAFEQMQRIRALNQRAVAQPGNHFELYAGIANLEHELGKPFHISALETQQPHDTDYAFVAARGVYSSLMQSMGYDFNAVSMQGEQAIHQALNYELQKPAVERNFEQLGDAMTPEESKYLEELLSSVQLFHDVFYNPLKAGEAFEKLMVSDRNEMQCAAAQEFLRAYYKEYHHESVAMHKAVMSAMLVLDYIPIIMPILATDYKTSEKGNYMDLFLRYADNELDRQHIEDSQLRQAMFDAIFRTALSIVRGQYDEATSFLGGFYKLAEPYDMLPFFVASSLMGDAITRFYDEQDKNTARDQDS